MDRIGAIKFLLAWACVICLLFGTYHVLTFLRPILNIGTASQNQTAAPPSSDDPMAMLEYLMGQSGGSSGGLAGLILGNDLIKAILFAVSAMILFIIARLIKS